VAATLIVPVVDQGLGNPSYLVDLGDGRALAVDAPRDPRAARTDLSGPEQAEPLARAQYASLRRLLTLPEATPVYPTHQQRLDERVLVTTFGPWAVAAVLLGAGTAMVYPTSLAAVDDVAHPAWRARSVGVYRLWRDGGFAVGAVLAGVIADAFGILAAIWVVAALTAASGPVVAMRMYETLPVAGTAPVR
jgi:hypothetical protein